MANKGTANINHPEIKEFDKLIHSFNRGAWEVYKDFLQMMTDAFISDHTPEHPREQHYMLIAKGYSSAEMQRFPLMMRNITRYMQETNRDCLSELWESYCANADMGQFFTPWSLCAGMAEMMVKDRIDWEKYTERKCYISDPSCGGGRTLVAALKQIPYEHMKDVCFHGIDLDGTVVYVAALNMLFFNANSYIVHGNTLTLEVYHVFQTIHTPCGGDIREITDPDEMKRIITMGLSERKYKEETPEIKPGTPIKTTIEQKPDKLSPEPLPAVKTPKNVHKYDSNELEQQLFLF